MEKGEIFDNRSDGGGYNTDREVLSYTLEVL